MSLREIESAIAQLPPRELAELVRWVEEHHAEAWEQQIEDDLDTGRLDKLLAEVEIEHKAGLALCY